MNILCLSSLDHVAKFSPESSLEVRKQFSSLLGLVEKHEFDLEETEDEIVDENEVTEEVVVSR